MGREISWLPLMYWRSMLNGDGRLRALVTSRHPDVRPTTVAGYVEQHREAFAHLPPAGDPR